MAKSKEGKIITVLQFILFFTGCFCLVYYNSLDKKAAKEYASITYHRIDTVYTDACNFKYEITYDTIYFLNHTLINKDTIRILKEAKSAKTELESNKALTANERARLKAKAAMGDSIWAFFDRKRMFFNHMAMAAKVSSENNKALKKYASEPTYNTRIEEELEEKDKRIIHKVKGDVTPDGSTENNHFLDADYYDNQHLLLIDFSIMGKGIFHTVLDSQGSVIIPASEKSIIIKKDCIVKDYWNSDKAETFDFKGNKIEGYINGDNLKNYLIYIGVMLIVLAAASLGLEILINLVQKRKE